MCLNDVRQSTFTNGIRSLDCGVLSPSGDAGDSITHLLEENPTISHNPCDVILLAYSAEGPLLRGKIVIRVN